MAEEKLTRARWSAVIGYRSDCGPLDVEHDIEELDELHDLVEQGPHWDTIIKIEVKLNRPAERTDLTVEEARKL